MKPVTLPANGQGAMFISELFEHDTSDFTGSVRCTAPPGEQEFTGVAVEMDDMNGIFTTLPVVPLDGDMSSHERWLRRNKRRQNYHLSPGRPWLRPARFYPESEESALEAMPTPACPTESTKVRGHYCHGLFVVIKSLYRSRTAPIETE